MSLRTQATWKRRKKRKSGPKRKKRPARLRKKKKKKRTRRGQPMINERDLVKIARNQRELSVSPKTVSPGSNRRTDQGHVGEQKKEQEPAHLIQGRDITTSRDAKERRRRDTEARQRAEEREQQERSYLSSRKSRSAWWF